MFPLFAKDELGRMGLKPLLQIIFEHLFDLGFREFCFIVGRGKRAIEDHFTPDHRFLEYLNSKDGELANHLESFYKRIEDSTILYLNQSEPLGFGHAVLLSKTIVGNEPVLVHAGDVYIQSLGEDHIRRLIGEHRKTGADVTITLHEVADPRQHGVAEVIEGKANEIRVANVVEKPDIPKTNLAIMPMYVFQPVIFEALENISLGKSGEVQLTDGIKKLIDSGAKVMAVRVKKNEIRFDVGSPESYWEAFNLSYDQVK